MNCILLTVVLYLGQLSSAVQPQTGIVTGRLVDNEGKPVVAVRVAAAELPRPGAVLESSKVLVAITQTDNAGRFTGKPGS